MTFNKKLALVCALGLALIVLISMAGCGEVTAASDPGADGAAGKVEAQADGGTGGEMTKLDVGAAGAAGATVTFGKPLGAGCATDGECASTICDGASRACCDGRSDVCSSCIGGYKTPVPDGVATCGVCEAGVLQPSLDGTACGTSVCGGPIQSTGEGTLPAQGVACEGSGARMESSYCYYPTATNSTCHAGACIAANIDCTSFVCPVGCTKLYSECDLPATGTAMCVCYDTNRRKCS